MARALVQRDQLLRGRVPRLLGAEPILDQSRQLFIRRARPHRPAHERDQIPALKRGMIFLGGMLFFFEVCLYAFAITLVLLFVRVMVRENMIREFEWKVVRLRPIADPHQIFTYEVSWANMKCWQDYEDLLAAIDEKLKG